jgi:hypothetical protein
MPLSTGAFFKARQIPLGFLLMVLACGGNGGTPPRPPSPPSTPAPPPISQNPCESAASLDEDSVAPRALVDTGKEHGGYGIDSRSVADLLWDHALRGTEAATPLDAGARPAATQDIGNIAVLEDDGTLFLRTNPFDLSSTGLRFERNAAGGYDAISTQAQFRSPLGQRLTLADDDTSQQTIAFAFPFFNTSFSSVFINSDGNLTFETSDTASTERGFARLLSGPPRIAPFFADLDPSTGNGRVFVQSAPNAFVVTWCGVRGFESTKTMTVQASLLPGGVIEFAFGSQTDLATGIVALSPGRNATFTPVDLNASGRQAGGSGALGERFADETELDLVSTSRRFFATHPDRFDQLIFWTDTTVVQDAFAFESTVANAIRGIGQDSFDLSHDFGSAGALNSVVVMDRLSKYSDDPSTKVLGESTTLAVLAHETGHRWLARLMFRDAGQPSDALLGRQRAHWSFFMDSDASVMEGNDIEDLRGGSFRTIAASQRYGRLDLYAMGLVSIGEVPPFFYVDAPVNVSPQRDRESSPRVGVTFNGTRRDVLVQDVVDALGPRVPASAESARLHRQAFVYIVGRGVTASAADIARLERIRRDWEPFFARSTENRMTVQTALQ